MESKSSSSFSILNKLYDLGNKDLLNSIFEYINNEDLFGSLLCCNSKWKELISNPFYFRKRTIHISILSELIQITKNYPYFTHLYCQEVESKENSSFFISLFKQWKQVTFLGFYSPSLVSLQKIVEEIPFPKLREARLSVHHYSSNQTNKGFFYSTLNFTLWSKLEKLKLDGVPISSLKCFSSLKGSLKKLVLASVEVEDDDLFPLTNLLQLENLAIVHSFIKLTKEPQVNYPSSKFPAYKLINLKRLELDCYCVYLFGCFMKPISEGEKEEEEEETSNYLQLETLQLRDWIIALNKHTPFWWKHKSFQKLSSLIILQPGLPPEFGSILVDPSPVIENFKKEIAQNIQELKSILESHFKNIDHLYVGQG